MNELPIQHTAPAPKKFNKIWIIVVVVLLIICCLCSLVMVGGGAGYYYLQNNNIRLEDVFGFNPPSEENSQESPADPLEESAPVSPDSEKPTQKPPAQSPKSTQEVASGKEIRSEEGGYAFKTIPDYKVTINDFIPGHIFMDAKDKVVVKIGAKDGPNISLFGQSVKTDITFDQYVKSANDGIILDEKATISNEQEITIAGKTGKAFDFDYEIPEIGKIKARAIFVEVNPKQFFLVSCYSPENKWDKTLADFKVVTDSVTFFDAKPKQK